MTIEKPTTNNERGNNEEPHIKGVLDYAPGGVQENPDHFGYVEYAKEEYEKGIEKGTKDTLKNMFEKSIIFSHLSGEVGAEIKEGGYDLMKAMITQALQAVGCTPFEEIGSVFTLEFKTQEDIEDSVHKYDYPYEAEKGQTIKVKVIANGIQRFVDGKQEILLRPKIMPVE